MVSGQEKDAAIKGQKGAVCFSQLALKAISNML